MKTPDQILPIMQRAVGHHKAGRFPEAKQAYLEVLEQDGAHADALRLLGGLYAQFKQPEQAAVYLRRALEIRPNDAELSNNLGFVLYILGKPDEAITCYQQAVRLKPDYQEAINNLGSLLFENKKINDAIFWFEQSLRLDPGNAKMHCRLGAALQEQGDPEQAIVHYEHALQIRPDNVEANRRLGFLLRNIGKLEAAQDAYQRLVALAPQDVQARLNLGTVFHDRGDVNAAMEQYDQVLCLQPDSHDALINRAGLLSELGHMEDARRMYDQALRVNPDSLDAKWGKSLVLLALGEYREGWKLYEVGFERKRTRGVIPFRGPLWDGRDFRNERLLIWGEQGLGDVVQFIRYAALCKEKGGMVLVMCRAPLVRLLKECPFIDQVVTTATETDFDFHVPVMSLPHIFSTTLQTIPAQVPYLYVSAEARQKWAPRFADMTGFKVGLVWAGNPRRHYIDAHIIDRRRSLNLEAMLPFFAFDDIHFVNLQMGDEAAQIDICGLRDRFADWMPDVTDFMDTAAIIEKLDLVISVDTSVVHLAGGLGKPVWVLSRFDGCWRWLRNQETNPWYPTARVFGQPAAGDWSSVVSVVTSALNRFRQS